jgi:uncharacterized protein YbaP (TraB family)
MMHFVTRVVLVALFAMAEAQGQESSDSKLSQEATAPLDEILVTGEQPGPGLWKITKGDHVLWVLGTQSPLPKKMTWRSGEVEKVVAESQELLTNPSVDPHIGFFTGLTLLPSFIGVRNNPNGAKLQDVVPAPLYARWKVLKEKYIGSDNDPEKWRPIFAAFELYSKAIDKSGMTSTAIAWPVVEKAAKKNKVKLTTPTINVQIDKPRAVIKEFKKSKLDDIDCFAKTMERLETDLDLMRARANAWARGDVPALKNMTHVDQAGACIAAVMNTQLVQERGYQTLPTRLADAWIEAAEAAIKNNRSTFAVLSIDEILKPDGLVEKFRAKGYTVEEP